MIYRLLTGLALLVFLTTMALGCASSERPRATPPPGSHSPFAGGHQGDPSQSMRDQPEPPPEEPEEEEFDEVEEER